MIRLFFLLVGVTVLAQTKYTFDTVYIYEGPILKVDGSQDIETRYYFVNNHNSNYFLLLREFNVEEISGVFRDNAKNNIAEFVIHSEKEILDITELSFPSELLKKNTYKNPLPYKKISRSKTPLNDTVIRYNYNIEKDKLFKNQMYTIDVDSSKKNILDGVGFGDYYSLFPLGEKVPEGLVVRATTNEHSETILSRMVLTEIIAFNVVLILN